MNSVDSVVSGQEELCERLAVRSVTIEAAEDDRTNAAAVKMTGATFSTSRLFHPLLITIAMPLSLAALKGLAVTVTRMNAEPVIPLETGRYLPRNSVIDTEHRWGFPAVRFDDTVCRVGVHVIHG